MLDLLELQWWIDRNKVLTPGGEVATLIFICWFLVRICFLVSSLLRLRSFTFTGADRCVYIINRFFWVHLLKSLWFKLLGPNSLNNCCFSNSQCTIRGTVGFSKKTMDRLKLPVFTPWRLGWHSFGVVKVQERSTQPYWTQRYPGNPWPGNSWSRWVLAGFWGGYLQLLSLQELIFVFLDNIGGSMELMPLISRHIWLYSIWQ